MVGRTTDLRRALKEIFIPFVRERGFEIDNRHAPGFVDFRRARGGRVEFLEIQWDNKGRPRFKFSFGSVAEAGSDCHGTRVAAGDVGPGQAPRYVSLFPNGNGSSTRHWFCQDNSFVKTVLSLRGSRPPEEVCIELLGFFPEVEAYFEYDAVGPHCRLFTTGFTDASA
ncbi:MAG TPA: hypothetical protein VFS58_13495 [Steroidobacteraceae bacterium]|nr:hypothetical protein [Steroidobacteraceae bacterium]